MEAVCSHSMREIVFQLGEALPGGHQPAARQGRRFEAEAWLPGGERVVVAAASLEELQHEARDVLIERLGPAHVAYRVRLQRPLASPHSRHRSAWAPIRSTPSSHPPVAGPL